MIVDIFLRRKNVEMLIIMRDRNTKWYLSLLAKKVDITYPHAVQIAKRLEEAGLIRTRKEGRTRYVELTEKGEEVAVALENAYRQLLRLDK